MPETYDIVIAGGGHNGLVAACYLAKAGLSVCVAERNEKVGGGVMTREYTQPGWKEDTHSVGHTIIQANPLMLNDELGLKSRYGLNYFSPDNMAAAIFDDGTTLEFYQSLERTCTAIAKFSDHDADAYYRFNQEVSKILDMLIMGMFSVPPGVGMQTAMLDQTPEGRELLRIQAMSSWDMIDGWFENPKVKIAIARYAAEAMTNPFDNGTGFGFYILLPYMHRFGAGIAQGGSWALAGALEQCLLDHGGVVKVDSTVTEILLSGQTATGVRLESGEEIHARKAVIANLHVQQVFPGMVQGAVLPPGFASTVRTIKRSDLQPMVIHLALHEDAKFKVGNGVDDFFWVDRAHTNVEDFAQALRDLQYGYPRRDFAAYCGPHKFDRSRVPEGKGAMHIYAFAPYDLKDGGSARWDEIGAQVAQGYIDDLAALTTNMTPDNIIARHVMTPLDIERHNISMRKADIVHMGFFNWQLGANRPVPGWGQYRTPVDRLFMSGASTHPGGGVSGGSGRNVAQVLLEELDIDFDKVIA